MNRVEKARELRELILAGRTAGRIAAQKLIHEETVTQKDLADLKPLYPEWKYPYDYATGDIFIYDDILWEVVQPHTSQEHFQPPDVPAHYKRHHSYGDKWIQPTGAHDAYKLDAAVTHNDTLWKSLHEANVWEPGTDETLWEKVD